MCSMCKLIQVWQIKLFVFVTFHKIANKLNIAQALHAYIVKNCELDTSLRTSELTFIFVGWSLKIPYFIKIGKMKYLMKGREYLYVHSSFTFSIPHIKQWLGVILQSRQYRGTHLIVKQCVLFKLNDFNLYQIKELLIF